jgi:hypothetical protein
MSEPVVVATVPGEPLVELVIQRLEEAGISASWRAEEDAGGEFSAYGAQIYVLVDPEDADRAREVLDADEPEPEP